MKKWIAICVCVACIAYAIGGRASYNTLKAGVENVSSSAQAYLDDFKLLNFVVDSLGHATIDPDALPHVFHTEEENGTYYIDYRAQGQGAHNTMTHVTLQRPLPQWVYWLEFSGVSDTPKVILGFITVPLLTLIEILFDTVGLIINLLESLFIVVGIS